MIPQARIIIGSSAQAAAAVTTLLQKELTRCGGCGACSECRRIAEERDWRMIIVRESTKEAIDRFLERCSYDSGEDALYGIIYDVDFLTASASARILKDLEEPRPGYRFILTARSADRVLPTILSRCHKQVLSPLPTNSQIDWARSIAQSGISPIPDLAITEECLAEELDALMHALSDAYMAGDVAQRSRVRGLIAGVQKIAEIPPLPGTSSQIIRALHALLAVSHTRS